MLDFLFLPPAYLLTVVFSGIVTGLTFDYIKQKPFILSTFILFFIFFVSQLIYRILEHLEPGRLVGQIIYFTIFLIVVFTTRGAKKKFIG
jgi:hypothetical protein